MGIKVTVDDIANVDSSSGVPTINENFDRVADEFDNVLYRDGSLAVTGDIDMDSNRILNLPDSISQSEPVTRREVIDRILDVAVYFTALGTFFGSTAEGLAGTTEGQYFTVLTDGLVLTYRHDAGPVATLVYTLPTSTFLASAEGADTIGTDLNSATVQDVFDVFYAEQPGEVGVLHKWYPVGDSRRYGVFPDGVTHWESTTDYMQNILRTALAGHKIYFRKDGADWLYATSWNWTTEFGYENVTMEFEEGTAFGSIFHMISSANPSSREVITNIVTGAVTTVTVGGGHGLPVGEARYVDFIGTDMAALEDAPVLATPTSATQLTVDANTTGQVWSGAGVFSDTRWKNVRLCGTVTSYDRFGAFNAEHVTIDRIHVKSDPDIHAAGLSSRGVHIFVGCDNWEVGEIVCDDTGTQAESPTNDAAVAIDGATKPPSKFHVGRIHVKDSAVSGVVLNGAIDVDQIVVDAYGSGVITSAVEDVAGPDPFGRDASECAAAVWLARHTGHIGSIHIDQKYGFGVGNPGGTRSFAAYGVACEGSFIDFTDEGTFTFPFAGTSIGLIRCIDCKGPALSIGAFGDAAYPRVEKIDIGNVSLDNDLVTTPSIGIAAGMVWLVAGGLSFGQITAGSLDIACGLKTESVSTNYCSGQQVLIHAHKDRAVWHRCPGTLVDVLINGRSSANTNPSVAVDGSSSLNSNILNLRGRGVTSAAAMLLFAPGRGHLGSVDITGSAAPTAAGNGMVVLGNNGANRISATGGGYLFNSGVTGNGLVLNGLVDSQIIGWKVEGFAEGVTAPNANNRLTAHGNISVNNTDNTDLTDAELMTGSKSTDNTNTNWSVP